MKHDPDQTHIPYTIRCDKVWTGVKVSLLNNSSKTTQCYGINNSLACLLNPDLDCEIGFKEKTHINRILSDSIYLSITIHLSLCTKVLWLWPRCAESYLSGPRGFHRGSTARSARSTDFGRWQLLQLLKEHIRRQTDWKSCWVEMVWKSSELWLEERSSWLLDSF